MPDAAANLEFAAGTLVLQGLMSTQVRRLFGPNCWTWDNRIAGWRCDALKYSGVRAILEESGMPFVDAVPKWRSIHWPEVNLPELRTEQRTAVSAWFSGRRNGVIVMPTGAGKTEVALAIMQHTAVSTLIVAPVRDLMYQWHRRIVHGLGYDAGIIGDHLFNVKPVSVTTYDSACIHMERLGSQFALLVFDECHHLPATLYRNAARMSAAPFRLGLTATPERSDGRHADLAQLMGSTVFALSLRDVRGSTLADYDVVRIPVHLTDAEQTHFNRLSWQLRRYLAKRRKQEPNFAWSRLYVESGNDPEARRALRAYHAKKAIEDRAAEKLRVLEDIFRLHRGASVLVFAGSNAMARDVSRRFLIPCLLSHCGKRERLEILDGMRDGTYPAVVANRVLDEGVDVPEVKVAVVIGGTASTRQAKQRLGRILRRSGNARGTLYEIVCVETNDEKRSQRRRRSEAFKDSRQRRISTQGNAAY